VRAHLVVHAVEEAGRGKVVDDADAIVGEHPCDGVGRGVGRQVLHRHGP
jgi:hypothetical protein